MGILEQTRYEANLLKNMNIHNDLINSQTEQIDPDQVQNAAGGYVWEVNKFESLKRFLVLGTESPTYYTSAKDLTVESLRSLTACLEEDGVKTVDVIRSMRDSAPKRDPILYALAFAFTKGNKETKDYIEKCFRTVVRTGSDILQFVSYIDNMRGWGRSLKRLVSSWYENALGVDYQVLKYQNRHGWTHKDVLRRCHYPANTSTLRWIVDADPGDRLVLHKDTGDSIYYEDTGDLPELLQGYEQIKRASSVKEVVDLIENHRFTHEMVPNEWKNDQKVWYALLENMPTFAMIRNLGKMTSIGLISPMSELAKDIADERLRKEAIENSLIHPINMLMARLTYGQGHGVRGGLEWVPAPNIVDALEEGFYHAFGNVEPTNKKTLIGVDVSSSMGSGEVAGCVGLTPALASAALSLLFANTEPDCMIMGFSHTFKPLNITARDNLQSALKKVKDKNFGATDCSLPMTYARQSDIDVENFIVLTDNETYYGNTHPSKALERYRNTRIEQSQYYKQDSESYELKLSASKARLAVIGMTATQSTIADPKDPGMMDFVGFDSSSPQVMFEFLNGNI